MEMNYQHLVRALARKLGGQKLLGEALGVSQPSISDWLKDAEIKGRNLIALYQLAHRSGFENADIHQAFEKAS